jgi:NitT/TauT family transport system substrate-binding protein
LDAHEGDYALRFGRSYSLAAIGGRLARLIVGDIFTGRSETWTDWRISCAMFYLPPMRRSLDDDWRDSTVRHKTRRAIPGNGRGKTRSGTPRSEEAEESFVDETKRHWEKEMPTKSLMKLAGWAVCAALAAGLAASGAQAGKIRIALAETPSDEVAAFFVALDRAKANGLEYEWTAFADEELAIQAVLSGQMDIGFGTPYAAMQKSKAPIRIVFQLSKLKFFPVTSKKYSKLEDLNGEPILLHSRGGGTDSIANVIEDKLNIKFGTRSYVPGSANRIVALVAGQTDATIVDLSNKNKLVKQQGDKFNVLPMFEVDASDEALFANLDWIKANEKDVDIFVKALVSVYRDMAKDPTIISKETDPNGPIGQLPKEILDGLDGFYADAVAGGLYDPNGGGRKAAKADLEWYSAAGQLTGDAMSLNIEDFWYLKPLDAATQ